MKRACIILRHTSNYRYSSFVSGLSALGFRLVDDLRRPTLADVLVLWNRYPRHERLARSVETAGGTVIVAENGWIGKSPDGGKMIALCRGHHNGAGWWPEGDPGRWERLGIDLQTWRSRGDHILLLPQRGYGEDGIAMPRYWRADAISRLRTATRRPIVVREHPGVDGAPDPDFTDAWAVATWASGGAIKAIAAGIPVFHDFDRWIGAAAAKRGFDDIEIPFLGDRLPMFRRLAWAEFSAEEIATGEPFRRLLQ